MKSCWWKHKWGNWSEIITRIDGYITRWQERKCLRCNVVETRGIYP